VNYFGDLFSDPFASTGVSRGAVSSNDRRCCISQFDKGGLRGCARGHNWRKNYSTAAAAVPVETVEELA
jgi:hypothetical protein